MGARSISANYALTAIHKVTLALIRVRRLAEELVLSLHDRRLDTQESQ